MTERLGIVPLRQAHPHHVKALNDRQHMRYSEQRHLEHTIATEEVYIQSAGPDRKLLDITYEGCTVGTMACDLNWLNLVCDMGIMILPEVTKLGFGREAWRAVMDHWLEQGFKVEAGMMAKNHAMIAICEATGMKYEGDRDNHFRVDGKPMGLVLFGKSP